MPSLRGVASEEAQELAAWQAYLGPALGEVPSLISVTGVVIVTAGILVTLGPRVLRPAPAAQR